MYIYMYAYIFIYIHLCPYLHEYRDIGPAVRVFANGPGRPGFNPRFDSYQRL